MAQTDLFLPQRRQKKISNNSCRDCQTSFISAVIAVIGVPSQSHAVALAISPLTSGIALAFCYRIWCGIERTGLGFWIGIGNRSRHRLRVFSPAVALAVDIIAEWISLAFFLFYIFITCA